MGKQGTSRTAAMLQWVFPRVLSRLPRMCVAGGWLVAGVLLLVGTAPVSLAREVEGKYRYRDDTIQLRVIVPEEKPTAVIVIQYLPPHTNIVEAKPPISSYTPETGAVKWLFSDVRPGELILKLQLAAPVDSKDVKAEVLFLDSSGHSSSYSVDAPRPIKRKGLEGC